MTAPEALQLLTTQAVADSAALPCCDEAKDDWLTPLSLAAVAELSGALPDADSWVMLCEAVEHGLMLINAEIIPMADWLHATEQLAIATLEDTDAT